MNLQTNYMGLELRSPIVVSACSLSENLDNILLMEDYGAGAVVLFSLFEEQLLSKDGARNYDNRKEVKNNFTAVRANNIDNYLELLRTAKEKIEIPIIASLNGITNRGWEDYAKDIEQAGADGLELNIYYLPVDLQLTATQVEHTYLEIIKNVNSCIDIPLAVKMSPYFSSIGNMAKGIQDAGADALVMFNRFYQPDYDIYQLEAVRSLEFSTPAEIKLPLRWIAMISDQINMSIGATTGVHSETEVIKYLLSGADVTMTASALYKQGIKELAVMREGLRAWMNRMDFKSLNDFRGMLSYKKINDPSALERANYLRILERIN